LFFFVILKRKRNDYYYRTSKIEFVFLLDVIILRHTNMTIYQRYTIGKRKKINRKGYTERKKEGGLDI